MKRKIVSLQALRALSFIGIFLCHARSVICWPALGVSVFFVLSGFLMIYVYRDKNIHCNLKYNILFSLNKIKKMYLLHLLTMLFAIVLQLVIYIHVGFTLKRMATFLGMVFLNVTLTQSWFPYISISTSLNGVAWYLSVMMFLYFIFPYIHRFIINKSTKWFIVVSIGILILECAVCIPWLLTLGNHSSVYLWFMYCFPLFRLGDFFIGCCLGMYYFNNEFTERSVNEATIIEVLATFLTIFIILWRKQEQSSILMQSFQNWTTVFIPLAVLWVYLFMRKEGLITKILSNRFLIFIGNISAYTFLIHYVITRYINSSLDYLQINLQGVAMYFIICLEFIITIILSLIYIRATKKNKIIIYFNNFLQEKILSKINALL